jgi:hypothetical protein
MSNIHLKEAHQPGDGFNIKYVDTSTFSALPFGGDTSNNAPLDSSHNPVQLNHSSWLKIELQHNDWSSIIHNSRPHDNIAYIPIYWYKS